MSSNRVVAITGASGGLGTALAMLHAAEGWDIIMVNRSEATSTATIEAITTAHPSIDVDVIEADLSRQDAVVHAAERLRARARIDRFVNNAGVLLGEKIMSTQGVEMHVQVNTIAPYLFGRILGPAMAGGSMSLITTSGINQAKHLAIGDLRDPPAFKKLFGPYVQSKLAATVVMAAIAQDYPNVNVHSVEPGAVKTSMTSGDGMPGWLVPIRNLLFSTPEKAATKVFATMNTASNHSSGTYFFKGKPRELPGNTGSTEVQQEILAWCRDVTGI